MFKQEQTVAKSTGKRLYQWVCACSNQSLRLHLTVWQPGTLLGLEFWPLLVDQFGVRRALRVPKCPSVVQQYPASRPARSANNS